MTDSGARRAPATSARVALRRALRAAIAIALLAAAATAAASDRYDPRLRFRTISTARFDIHFHQGEEALARRLATFIEEAAGQVDAAIGPPEGRVQVILSGQNDLPNGWATPVPVNTIEITTAVPSASSALGNSTDWLRLVFVHEYTHVAHLSRARGWIGGLRRGFGRLPILFPNLYQPLWAIEGLATWQESAETGEGRVPAGDFGQLLSRAAAVGRFEPIDRANGGTVDWPSGAIPYLYGAYFHRFLAERHGADAIRRLADETSRRVPYLGSRAFKEVFGQSLGELWNEYETATEAQVGSSDNTGVRAVRLTHHGFEVSGPRVAPDGRLFYSTVSPHDFPALMEIARPGEAPRQVARRYLGTGIGFARGGLVVDEIDMVRGAALQSDLYLVDPQTGRRERLTRDARAMDPDVSPDGRFVACTIQMADRRALAIMPLAGAATVGSADILVSEPGTSFAAPRWSPDGARIAAERRRTGGPSEIVIVHVRDRTVRALTNLPGRRSASPVWFPDGDRLLFASAVGEQPFRLYSVDAQRGAVARLEGTGESAEAPALSPDGRTLVFVGYTPAGYDLFSMSLDGATWTPIGTGRTDVDVAAPQQTASSMSAADGEPYSPGATLVPRFWTPVVTSESGEVTIGAATGSTDALARHAYGVQAAWGTRARPDWRIAYAYDRWRPTFFVSIGDDTDPWRDGHSRTREADAGMLLRIPGVRVSHAVLVSAHRSEDSLTCDTCDRPVDLVMNRSSLRGGWEVSSARTYGYSISAEDGARLTATVELTRAALGADADGAALTLDGRRYWHGWPRHGVFALRAAVASSWGEGGAARVFSAAGPGPQTGGFPFDTDAIGLLRGFAEDAVTGTRAATTNADYRFPLARIDRGVGTVPLFVRAVHGAVFADAGSAWSASIRDARLRGSIGAELSVDAVLGFALPVTFATGAAWRHGPAPGDRGVVGFARIGRAF